MKKATESTDSNPNPNPIPSILLQVSHFGFYLFSSWASLSCLLCTFCLCFGFSAVLLHLISSSNIHLISQKSNYSLFKMFFWVQPVSRCCSPPMFLLHQPCSDHLTTTFSFHQHQCLDFMGGVYSCRSGQRSQNDLT